jgi:hypothetical protein
MTGYVCLLIDSGIYGMSSRDAAVMDARPSGSSMSMSSTVSNRASDQ